LTPERKLFGAWLLDSTLAAREAFIDEITKWDGWESTKLHQNKQYYSSLKINVDWVQTLAHLTGRATNICVRQSQGNRGCAFTCNLRNTVKTWTSRKHWTDLPKTASTVYCPSTITGFWLYRFNGTIAITGNTGRESSGGERTGRMKSGGFNDKNLPRKEMFGADFFLGKDGEKGEGARFAHLWTPESRGINLRNRIIPAPGNKFVLSDLKTIEPRVEWDMVGDYDSLALVKAGMSVYAVHATQTMGWPADKNLDELKETDPAALAVYQFAKARVLALGYQAGWIKFITMAKLYDADAAFDVPITPDDAARFETYLKHCRIPEWKAMWQNADATLRQTYVNSWKIVTEFRRTNPKIVGWWKELHTMVRKAVGEDLEIELPSGRILLYRDVRMDSGEMSGTVIKFGRPMRMKLYGGILAENICQAIARDVFIEGLIRVNQAGHKVVLDVYDELVAEVPIDADVAAEIQSLMAVTPAWRPTLPVGASVKEAMMYQK
jgi:DNA polymerase